MPEKTITVELTLPGAAKVAEVMEDVRSGSDIQTADLCADIVAAVNRAVWEPRPDLTAETIAAIDGMLDFLSGSGLGEETFALYPHTKRLADLRAALASSTGPDPENSRGVGEVAELERYRDVFGDLCWNCGGTGDVAGGFSDPDSGGIVVCPECRGKGTKPETDPATPEPQYPLVSQLRAELHSEGAALVVCAEVSGLSPENREDVGDVQRALVKLFGPQSEPVVEGEKCERCGDTGRVECGPDADGTYPAKALPPGLQSTRCPDCQPKPSQETKGEGR